MQTSQRSSHEENKYSDSIQQSTLWSKDLSRSWQVHGKLHSPAFSVPQRKLTC